MDPLILGLWLVILRPLGSRFAFIPGDLGDARFNNYVLEHFFRCVTGLTRDYWNAPFFFPFQQTISFGDNLLGSAPFYAIFRWAGLDMASAFQGWYILGSLLNFVAAGYVLWRLKLKPLAVGTGAFFFVFGLPLLAQENHVQLLYRFCVPLVCFSLWRFYQAPRLRALASLVAWLVWQFFLTIYLGIFLLLLLAVLVVLLPFNVPTETFGQRLAVWPRHLMEFLVSGPANRANICGDFSCGSWPGLCGPDSAILSRLQNLWFFQELGGGFQHASQVAKLPPGGSFAVMEFNGQHFFQSASTPRTPVVPRPGGHSIFAGWHGMAISYRKQQAGLVEF